MFYPHLFLLAKVMLQKKSLIAFFPVGVVKVVLMVHHNARTWIMLDIAISIKAVVALSGT